MIDYSVLRRAAPYDYLGVSMAVHHALRLGLRDVPPLRTPGWRRAMDCSVLLWAAEAAGLELDVSVAEIQKAGVVCNENDGSAATVFFGEEFSEGLGIRAV